MARFLFLKEVCKIRLGSAKSLAHLDQNALVQLKLITVLNLINRTPVMVPHKSSTIIINHNTLIERVILEISILPALRFATQIVGVKTLELDH